MSVTEISRATAAEGSVDELRKQLATAIPKFAEQPGCTSATVYQGIEDPETFFMVIEWDSVEEHLAWRESESEHRKEFIANVRPHFRGKNDSAHYVRVASS